MVWWPQKPTINAKKNTATARWGRKNNDRYTANSQRLKAAKHLVERSGLRTATVKGTREKRKEPIIIPLPDAGKRVRGKRLLRKKQQERERERKKREKKKE